MKILRAEVQQVAMGLRAPYTIAYATFTSASNVFVQLVTDSPHVGLGCAAPDAKVTGESVEASTRALIAAAPALVGGDPRFRRRLLAELDPTLRDAPAARAALDMALLDLLGKVANLPVWALLGGVRDSIKTSCTVTMDTPEAMLREAERLVGLGFSSIKIKGGHSPGGDAEILRTIRRSCGPDIGLRFDANQGYSKADALSFARHLGDVRLQVFEQPTRRGESTALKAVTDTVASPVMADESLIDLADALRLAKGDLVDMLNVKLMKVGGIDAAAAVDAIARAAGYPVMVGCMDESALSIAAGLHFALSRPVAPLADLDGHLDLLEDPGDGAVTLHRGVLRPVNGPGLGLARLSIF